MRYLKAVIVCLALLVAVEGRVYAYTDPGSGTMLLQMLAALAVGLLFYIRRITTWVRRRFSNTKSDSQTDTPNTESREGAQDKL